MPSVHYRHHTYVPWKLDKPRIQRRHPGAKERWAKPLRTKTPAMAGCNKGTLPVGLQAPQIRRAAASFNRRCRRSFAAEPPDMQKPPCGGFALRDGAAEVVCIE